MQKALQHISDVPVLESDRLILKPLSTIYLSQKYVDWMNDEQVIRYLESGGDYTLDKLNSYLEEVESNLQYFWAITLRSTGEHIGNIKIDPIHFRNKFGEYGIMIGDRTSWGKGFAKEASNLVLDYCFQKLNLRKINLGVIASNEVAIKLYKQLGFEIEGHLKEHVTFEGKYVDSFRMAIFNNQLR